MSPFVSDCMFRSWGRVKRATHAIAYPRFRDELVQLVSGRDGRAVLPVGLGRSYGDTVMNGEGCLIDMHHLDRVISFDREAGILCAEAGLSLDAALSLIVPHGWFLTTTPGTRFVTLGGAVANDVHGKNHHRAGTFGRSVRRLGLLRSDGSEQTLDAGTGGDLFRATIGGLGLTGAITWVELKLARIPSANLDLERVAFRNIGEFFVLAAESAESHEHTVAWVDCASSGRALGRGIFQRANWSSSGSLTPHSNRTKATIPFDAPNSALNRLTMRAFNALYYRQQKAAPARLKVHYDKVFYPLDAIGRWNRLYGRRGFYQYQCVVPPDGAKATMAELLRQISSAGAGSFLAVLKTFGSLSSPGFLSFPRLGATLALDFPNKGEETLMLLARLDTVVLEAGGRLYPAKDGRMPAAMFRAGYPDLPAFARHLDPAFSSDFWKRVSA
jgi:L-gulonolactone oxidase